MTRYLKGGNDSLAVYRDSSRPTFVAQEFMPEMLQTLLTERFQLKLRRETRNCRFTRSGSRRWASSSPNRCRTRNAPAAPPDTVTVIGGGNSSGSASDLGGGWSFTIGEQPDPDPQDDHASTWPRR